VRLEMVILTYSGLFICFHQMKNGKEFLLTDTVGFIQKLPTTLVRKITLLQIIFFLMFFIQQICFWYFYNFSEHDLLST